MSPAKPLTLIIEHTMETLVALPVPRRIELLEALIALSVCKHESGLLRAQCDSLRAAEVNQAQLLLDLHAQRCQRASA